MSHRPTPATVIAILALCVAAFGGTAIALKGKNTVDSGDLRNGQVKAADLQDPKVIRVKNNPNAVPDPPPPGSDPCATRRTAILCGHDSISGLRGWRAVGDGFATPAFYRDGFGTVHLMGAVSEGIPSVESEQIFILPSGYRPAKKVEFAVAREQGPNTCGGETCDEGTAVVQIRPNGDVVPVYGNRSEGIALDGISFLAR